ncbi:hypothetical protein QUW50_06145 [Barnesiella viscericola]|uniref:hypothetical protein n=1 Tax=Barnesiella viscericola TaxID=397865 RepID=UPI0025A37A31|nr:hypothetical protein [Barnesiella viscericola]MDM8268618.1 hypothetical protein [Barnesiella viscericola]
MKPILTLLPALLLALPVVAADCERDTTVYFNQKEIQIKDSADIVSVKVFEGDTPYKKFYESRYADGKRQTSWELSESVAFPFSDLITGNKAKKRKRFDPHWSGVGFGFCNGMGNGLRFLNNPNGISLDFSGSFEIFWNFITVYTPIGGNNWGFVTGLGIDWRNYVMNENRYFVKQEGKISVVPCPEDADLDFSRLKTVDLTVPLLFEWQTHKFLHGPIFFSLGPVIGIKTYSSTKTKYTTADGQKIQLFEKGIKPNPINLDIMAQGGYGTFGFYVKLSPFNVLQQSRGPQMRSFSAGVMLHF